MPPQRQSPTESQLRQSEELKQRGNDAFRAKNFTDALRFYTEAISLTPTSPTLYSNRSASFLSISAFPSALNDANRAVELDPNWAKAHRRKASVLDAMKRFREALKVYEDALEVIKRDERLDAEAKKKEEVEVTRLVKEINKKLNESTVSPAVLFNYQDVDRCPGVLIMREAERKVLVNGEELGVWPEVGSCKRRLWIAEMQFRNALAHLYEFHTRPITVPGTERTVEAIVGRLQTLEELTTAMVEDIRVGRFDQEALDKLKLCLTLEQQQRNAVGPQMSPRETVEEYNRRLTESPSARGPFPWEGGGGSVRAAGWDYVRPALQLSIRSCLMSGLLMNVIDPSQQGADEFRRAVDIVEEARKMWPDVNGSLRGRSLEDTFLRQIQVLLGESLIVKYTRLPSSATREDRAALLDEIFAIGNSTKASVLAHPTPPESERYSGPAGEDGWWGVYYAHYATPLSKAYSLIAFVHLHYGTDILTHALDSPTTGKRGPIACSPASLGLAAINYAKSAAWTALDDPFRCNMLWYCIFSMVQRGGYYLADFEVIRDMASKGPEHFTPYFPEEIIPENHSGKRAAGEVLGTVVGGAKDMICSPMVRWPDDAETDIETLHEVMEPWTRDIVTGEEGGLLAVTEVVREVWRERVEVYGERDEAMGGWKIWGDVEERVKRDWEEVWMEWEGDGEEMRVFGG